MASAFVIFLLTSPQTYTEMDHILPNVLASLAIELLDQDFSEPPIELRTARGVIPANATYCQGRCAALLVRPEGDHGGAD